MGFFYFQKTAEIDRNTIPDTIYSYYMNNSKNDPKNGKILKMYMDR